MASQVPAMPPEGACIAWTTEAAQSGPAQEGSLLQPRQDQHGALQARPDWSLPATPQYTGVGMGTLACAFIPTAGLSDPRRAAQRTRSPGTSAATRAWWG